MNLYVVTNEDADGDQIFAVCTDVERAKEIARAHNPSKLDVNIRVMEDGKDYDWDFAPKLDWKKD